MEGKDVGLLFTSFQPQLFPVLPAAQCLFILLLAGSGIGLYTVPPRSARCRTLSWGKSPSAALCFGPGWFPGSEQLSFVVGVRVSSCPLVRSAHVLDRPSCCWEASGKFSRLPLLEPCKVLGPVSSLDSRPSIPGTWLPPGPSVPVTCGSPHLSPGAHLPPVALSLEYRQTAFLRKRAWVVSFLRTCPWETEFILLEFIFCFLFF